MSEPQDTACDWPLRPWILSALLGAAGLLNYLVAGDDGPGTQVPWKAALTTLLFFGPVALAFTLERDRWRAPLAFAAIVGAVMAGLAWRAVGTGDSYADPEFGFMAGVLATGLALPLFQAGFHLLRWRTDYRAIHGHVGTDAICAAGSLAFVGVSWLMLLLLAELFHLLKLDFLRDLLREGWFGWTWSGAAFGAALGVLRNAAAIIGTLRRVVMTVLSLLAVPLAAGLALFLVAMMVSGPEVLWEATRSATPVLLTCAAGAWVLANAILRDEDASMSGNRVLGWAGLVLVLSILPLTVFAAVSMGTRIAQHGLSPERLWGLVAIGVAVAYGLAWLVAVVRGWKGNEWRERVRRANLHLAVLICGMALFLALPILDFGAISARQQVARLNSGAVRGAAFDYSALRWDFGDAGRRALAALTKSSNGFVRNEAKKALAEKDRFGPIDQSFAGTFQVRPIGRELPPALRTAITSNLFEGCSGESVCRVFLQPDGITAIVIDDDCSRPGLPREDSFRPGVRCQIGVAVYRLERGKWVEPSQKSRAPMSEAEERKALRREREAIERGDVTIGPVPEVQVYVGGKPAGQRFDPSPNSTPPLEGAPPPR